jgi:transposase
MIGFLWEHTVSHWVRQSWDSGRNLGLNYQLRFGHPVSATHDLNRQKVKELNQENQQISQREGVENLNTGLASVSEIIAGLGQARPHNAAATSTAIQNISFEVVPLPPYSPDLALSDLWLFAALKEDISGINFTLYEE